MAMDKTFINSIARYPVAPRASLRRRSSQARVARHASPGLRETGVNLRQHASSAATKAANVQRTCVQAIFWTMVRFSGESSNRRQVPFAKASENTPSSNELQVACHPKLEERRVVPRGGIEPPTRGFSVRVETLLHKAFSGSCRVCVALSPGVRALQRPFPRRHRLAETDAHRRPSSS